MEHFLVGLKTTKLFLFFSIHQHQMQFSCLSKKWHFTKFDLLFCPKMWMGSRSPRCNSSNNYLHIYECCVMTSCFRFRGLPWTRRWIQHHQGGCCVPLPSWRWSSIHLQDFHTRGGTRVCQQDGSWSGIVSPCCGMKPCSRSHIAVNRWCSQIARCTFIFFFGKLFYPQQKYILVPS